MGIGKRYLVYTGLFVLMFINYLDRVNLSVAAKSIADNYGLSPIDMGYIFSAFLWTYLVCLIPMGILTDRFGPRPLILPAIVLLSSLFASMAFLSPHLWHLYLIFTLFPILAATTGPLGYSAVIVRNQASA